MRKCEFLCTVVVLAASWLVSGTAIHAQDKEVLKISKAEARMIELTNQERKKADLPLLKPNADLFTAARKHTANMVKQKKLAHELDGKKLIDRIKATPYRYLVVGENVAFDPNSVEVVIKGFMDSEGHRANILDKEFTEIGVGVVEDAEGVTWYTQVFGAQRPK